MNESVVKLPKRVCLLWTGGQNDAVAFERTLRMCESANLTLDIVGMKQPVPVSTWEGAPSTLAGDDECQAATLESLVIQARQRNVSATWTRHTGDASELTHKIQAERYSLVVKAAEPSSMVRRLFRGDDDRRFLRMCPSPVWIVRPTENAGRKRILAAVDPALAEADVAADEVQENLNRAVIEMAVLLAQLDDAELHIVHVWDFCLEEPLQSRAGFATDVVEHVGQSYKFKHKHALTRLLEPYRQRISRVHLLKGRVADEIARLAARLSVDTVVMGTVLRSGLSRLLFGNTAQTVLDKTECSLLTVNPRESADTDRLGRTSVHYPSPSVARGNAVCKSSPSEHRPAAKARSNSGKVVGLRSPFRPRAPAESVSPSIQRCARDVADGEYRLVDSADWNPTAVGHCLQ